MPMEDASESLNLILSNQPKDFQIEIRKWWRGKMKLAFILSGFTAGAGLIFGYLISLAGNCTGVISHG